jgi:drug/metabolite transporter (DMT)-like permease
MQQKSRIWMFFVALAGLCWGVYVPLIAEGGKELHSAFAAFLCVGGAYFLLAVLLPIIILWMRGRSPAWNARGITFSTLAGVAGAVGALCVIFATFVFGGPPMFVAPVIFALAPVINTVVSLFWHPDEGALTFGSPREPVHWSLYLGVVLAGLGAALVLLAKDLPSILAGNPVEFKKGYTFVIFVLLAGLSWGVYVPLIAQGGKDLKNSYGSFLCVGAAYFVIAVLLPLGMHYYQASQPGFKPPDVQPVAVTLASLSGVAGAIGAVCVIFATFEFKGPRMYVAPVIFALAPVINTIVTLFWHPSATAPMTFGPPDPAPHWSLYVGIVAAGLGAGLVLFAKELGEAKHAAHLKQQADAAPGSSGINPEARPAPTTEAIQP